MICYNRTRNALTEEEAGNSAQSVGAFSFMQRTSPTGRKAEL